MTFRAPPPPGASLRDGRRGDVKGPQGRRRGERERRRRCPRKAMPLLDLQNQLGINLDRWMLRLSSKQPFQQPSVCHTFEKEWLECSEGIGMTRAKEECRLEAEDLEECMTKRKMMKRIRAILKQRDLMIKEGKYMPPNYQND
ncbi:LOW QUALITY PROTEIN: NADH dehydrogenase [ubiquinone] iron-sulfur protein 5 [Vipera latastei]